MTVNYTFILKIDAQIAKSKIWLICFVFSIIQVNLKGKKFQLLLIKRILLTKKVVFFILS